VKRRAGYQMPEAQQLSVNQLEALEVFRHHQYRIQKHVREATGWSHSKTGKVLASLINLELLVRLSDGEHTPKYKTTRAGRYVLQWGEGRKHG
jgi:DNA-binding MarR family transcriptional regulator